MAYTKLNWTEEIPLNSANLDHMETQYDEVIDDVDTVMANDTQEFRAEVVSSFPTPATGRLIYHTGNARYYIYDGADWQIVAVPGNSGV